MNNQKQSRTLIRNKQKILEAALEVFLSEGISFATVNQIADKANMTKRTIFNYYASKDLLAEDLQITLLRKITEVQTVDFSRGVNALEKIRLFLDAFIQTSPEFINIIKYITAFDYHYVKGYPTKHYGEEVANIVTPFYQLASIIEEGQAAGIIRNFPFVSSLTIFLSVFQLYNAYIQRFYYRQEAIKEENFPDAMGNPKFVVDMILLGLATSSEHIPPR